jgi:hypothetical protein
MRTVVPLLVVRRGVFAAPNAVLTVADPETLASDAVLLRVGLGGEDPKDWSRRGLPFRLERIAVGL